VRLCSDLHLQDRALARDDGEWVLELPPLAIDRLEYELEVVRDDGTVEVVADPANPVRAAGAFRGKSVLAATASARRWWLAAAKAPGQWNDVPLGPVMRRNLTTRVWSPAGTERHDALPMLLAHDGPEYDALAQLSGWAGAVVAAGSLPPFRLVL